MARLDISVLPRRDRTFPAVGSMLLEDHLSLQHPERRAFLERDGFRFFTFTGGPVEIPELGIFPRCTHQFCPRWKIHFRGPAEGLGALVLRAGREQP